VIGSTRNVAVRAHAMPTDMRKSFDTLAALVTAAGFALLSGELFLFVSKDRTRAKVLYWDGTGLCVFAKRLERGRFASPWSSDGRPLQWTVTELALFLEGSTLVGKVPLSPAPVRIGGGAT
jgi:transposase